MIELMSIDDLLKINLDIPNYQRPYKWQNKSTIDLLNDIAVAIDEYEKYSDFKYRVGTIICIKMRNLKINLTSLMVSKD